GLADVELLCGERELTLLRDRYEIAKKAQSKRHGCLLDRTRSQRPTLAVRSPCADGHTHAPHGTMVACRGGSVGDDPTGPYSGPISIDGKAIGRGASVGLTSLRPHQPLGRRWMDCSR